MEKITLQKFLRQHRRIVLDTMVFIYQFEADRRFGPQTQTIFEALESQRVHGIMSVITLHELLVKPKKVGDIPLALKYTQLLAHSPYIDLANIGQEDAEVAAGLRVKYALTAPDAFVVASGLTREAHGFITADKKLSRIQEIDTFILR